MSRHQFNLLYMFWTLVGLVVTAITARWALTLPLVDHATGLPNKHLFLAIALGALISGIIGVLIALKSSNPLVSLFGYMLVAAPFGLLLGPVVDLYTPASVMKVLLITGGLVGTLAVIGAVIPESLEGWGAWLFGGLIVLLIGQFLVPIAHFFGVPVEGAMKAMDWVGVALFSGYVIFDVNRAQRVERTADNAIDCALALYLDIINLFIRLLQLAGTKKD